MVKKHVILMIVLAVLKESHPLNPEILKYDRYMKDFEATGRQLKREKNEEMNPLIVKRQDQSSTDIYWNIWPGRHTTEATTEATTKHYSEAKLDRTLLEKCMHVEGFKGRKFLELDGDERGQVHGCMNREYETIKKLVECQEDQDHFRGLMHIFSVHHYPKWFAQKTGKKGEMWDRMFLNVHEPVVNKIKYLLKNDDFLDEESFREHFVHRGYWSWGSEQHPMTITHEAEEFIRKCIKTMHFSKTVNRMINIMLEDVKSNTSGLELLYKEYQLLDKKISVNEVARLKLYKALRITNVHPDFQDEMKLKKELAKEDHVRVFYNEKPNIAYILFRNFSEAYSAWEKVNEGAASYTKDGQGSNAAIINQFTDIPEYETHCTIKVPCEVKEQCDQEFSNGNCIPKCSRQKDVTLYTYKNIFDAQQFIEKNKNKVKIFCPGMKIPKEIQLIKNPS